MKKQKRKPTKNLATVLNKPYPLSKQWIAAVLTLDNRRTATIRIEASYYEERVAKYEAAGFQVEDVQL